MDHKVLNTSMTQIRHEGNGEKQKKADFIQLSITYNCSIPEF